MTVYPVAKLTDQFEKFLEAFEKLDTHVLFLCINKNEEAPNDSKTAILLNEVLQNVLAKRADLTSDDLARMLRLFTQALK